MKTFPGERLFLLTSIKAESGIGIFRNSGEKHLICQSGRLRAQAASWSQRWRWAAFTGVADERPLFHESLISFFTPLLSGVRDWFASLGAGEGDLIIENKWSVLLPPKPVSDHCSSRAVKCGRQRGYEDRLLQGCRKQFTPVWQRFPVPSLS